MTEKINSYYLATDPKPADDPEKKQIALSADAYMIYEMLKRIADILARRS